VELQLTDAGTFAAPVSFPLPGHWDLIARIDAGEHHFDIAQRIFVQR
jgi:nitrogen fixation protein FixH